MCVISRSLGVVITLGVELLGVMTALAHVMIELGMAVAGSLATRAQEAGG